LHVCRHANVLRKKHVSLGVLLIEDSPASQLAFAELLGVFGFHVLSIIGKESVATEWFEAHRDEADVVVLDLLLLEGSGFNLIERAKVHQSHAKVVIFSSYATPAVAEKCLRMGADAVFLKSELDDLTVYLKDVARNAAD
jgi:DNA-binding NarL/FixJ family response regulator